MPAAAAPRCADSIAEPILLGLLETAYMIKPMFATHSPYIKFWFVQRTRLPADLTGRAWVTLNTNAITMLSGR